MKRNVFLKICSLVLAEAFFFTNIVPSWAEVTKGRSASCVVVSSHLRARSFSASDGGIGKFISDLKEKIHPVSIAKDGAERLGPYTRQIVDSLDALRIGKNLSDAEQDRLADTLIQVLREKVFPNAARILEEIGIEEIIAEKRAQNPARTDYPRTVIHLDPAGRYEFTLISYLPAQGTPKHSHGGNVCCFLVYGKGARGKEIRYRVRMMGSNTAALEKSREEDIREGHISKITRKHNPDHEVMNTGDKMLYEFAIYAEPLVLTGINRYTPKPDSGLYQVDRVFPNSGDHGLVASSDGSDRVAAAEPPSGRALAREIFSAAIKDPDPLRGAAEAARSFGYEVTIDDEALSGHVEDAADRIVTTIEDARHEKPHIFLWSGKTTVEHPSRTIGKGGSNSHLVVAVARSLHLLGLEEVTFLAASPSGRDGRWNGSGAIVTGRTYQDAERAGLDPLGFLERYDTGTFLERLEEAQRGTTLAAGDTGVAAADLAMAIVPPRSVSGESGRDGGNRQKIRDAANSKLVRFLKDRLQELRDDVEMILDRRKTVSQSVEERLRRYFVLAQFGDVNREILLRTLRDAKILAALQFTDEAAAEKNVKRSITLAGRILSDIEQWGSRSESLRAQWQAPTGPDGRVSVDPRFSAYKEAIEENDGHWNHIAILKLLEELEENHGLAEKLKQFAQSGETFIAAEFGTGNGPLTEALRTLFEKYGVKNYKILTSDVNPSWYTSAYKRYREETPDPRVEFYLTRSEDEKGRSFSDFESIAATIGGQKVHLVIGSHSIHLIDGFESFVKGVKQALLPGGIFAVQSLNVDFPERHLGNDEGAYLIDTTASRAHDIAVEVIKTDPEFESLRSLVSDEAVASAISKRQQTFPPVRDQNYYLGVLRENGFDVLTPNALPGVKNYPAQYIHVRYEHWKKFLTLELLRNGILPELDPLREASPDEAKKRVAMQRALIEKAVDQLFKEMRRQGGPFASADNFIAASTVIVAQFTRDGGKQEPIVPLHERRMAFVQGIVAYARRLKPAGDPDSFKGIWKPVRVDELAKRHGLSTEEARRFLIETGQFKATLPFYNDRVRKAVGEKAARQVEPFFTARPGTLYFNATTAGENYETRMGRIEELGREWATSARDGSTRFAPRGDGLRGAIPFRQIEDLFHIKDLLNDLIPSGVILVEGEPHYVRRYHFNLGENLDFLKHHRRLEGLSRNSSPHYALSPIFDVDSSEEGIYSDKAARALNWPYLFHWSWRMSGSSFLTEGTKIFAGEKWVVIAKDSQEEVLEGTFKNPALAMVVTPENQVVAVRFPRPPSGQRGPNITQVEMLNGKLLIRTDETGGAGPFAVTISPSGEVETEGKVLVVRDSVRDGANRTVFSQLGIHSIRELLREDLAGKLVFVRADLDVPIKNGEVDPEGDDRLKVAIETIQYLADRGARVVVLGHLGQPKGQAVESLRMVPVARRLNQLLGVKVLTADDSIGEEVDEAKRELKNGQILLLENVRFHPEEEKPTPEYTQKLFSLADTYILDAPATWHRPHASLLPPSNVTALYVGFSVGETLEKMVPVRQKLIENPSRPSVLVVGGKKLGEKIGLLEDFVEYFDTILIGGKAAFTVMKAAGLEVGENLVDQAMLGKAVVFLEKARQRGVKVLLPTDFVDDKDIGPHTIELFEHELMQAKTVAWFGALGKYDDEESGEKYAGGTREIGETISDLMRRGGLAYSFAGGGDTVTALKQGNDPLSGFSEYDTGGGANLTLLAKGIDALPALVALRARDGGQQDVETEIEKILNHVDHRHLDFHNAIFQIVALNPPQHLLYNILRRTHSNAVKQVINRARGLLRKPPSAQDGGYRDAETLWQITGENSIRDVMEDLVKQGVVLREDMGAVLRYHLNLGVNVGQLVHVGQGAQAHPYHVFSSILTDLQFDKDPGTLPEKIGLQAEMKHRIKEWPFIYYWTEEQEPTGVKTLTDYTKIVAGKGWVILLKDGRWHERLPHLMDESPYANRATSLDPAMAMVVTPENQVVVVRFARPRSGQEGTKITDIEIVESISHERILRIGTDERETEGEKHAWTNEIFIRPSGEVHGHGTVLAESTAIAARDGGHRGYNDRNDRYAFPWSQVLPATTDLTTTDKTEVHRITSMFELPESVRPYWHGHDALYILRNPEWKDGVFVLVGAHRFIPYDKDVSMMGGMWVLEHNSKEEAAARALSYSLTMSRKLAWAGLIWDKKQQRGVGGGRVIINLDPNSPDKRKVLESVTKKLGELNLIFTGQGLNVDEEDALVLASISPAVIGTTHIGEGKLPLSRLAAEGAFLGLQAGPEFVFKNAPTLEGKKILLHGAGPVGWTLLEILLEKTKTTQVVVADKDPKVIGGLRKVFSEAIASGRLVVLDAEKEGTIYDVSADIFCPCATEGDLTQGTIQRLKKAGIRYIAGSVNEPIERPRLGGDRHITYELAQLMHHLGILYAPDEIVAAGRLIGVGSELFGYDAQERLHVILDNLRQVFTIAMRDHRSPLLVADDIADIRIQYATDLRSSTDNREPWKGPGWWARDGGVRHLKIEDPSLYDVIDSSL